MPTRIVAGGNELLEPQTILKDHLAVRPGQIVAAFGCGGSGYFTMAAARMVGEQGQVYAVDIVKTVLVSVDSKAKLQGLYNVKTVWSDLEMYGATEIPQQSVDHGLLVNILFQSKQQEAIIKEVSRLIKPGGKLLIIDWNDAAASFGPPMSERVRPDFLRDVVPMYGYQEEKFFAPGQYHFGILFVKT